MADSGDGAVSPNEGENNSDSAVNTTSRNENGEAVTQQAQEQPQPQRQGWWPMLKSMAVRMVFIYFISSWFRRPATQPADQGAPGATAGPGGILSRPNTNLYDKGTFMDLYVYYSESEVFDEFNDKSLLWLEEELVFGDWTSGLKGDGTYERKGQIEITQNVMNNGSIYLHVFLVKSSKSPDPSDKENYDKSTIHKFKRMNKYKKRKFHQMTNLLTGTTDAHPDLVRAPNDNVTMEILSHWHPNLTINIIDDHTPWVKGSVPAPLDDYIDFNEDGPNKGKYNPILFFNEYWNLNNEFMPINETTPVLNFTFTYQPISLFRWQMYAAQGMRKQWYSFMGDDFMEESDDDQDSLKQTFLDTNPYLLGLTVVVSLVHSVFEFLAFKNDIQFWKNRKSMEGLSVRSVFFNVFQSVIVLLYVMDNETNFVVRVSVFIGLGIEIWKIFKVVDVQLDRENPWFGSIPRIRLADKSTYTASSTKKYDVLAFKYLSWALFPMLGAYSIYSLFYMEHKGWYSWVLNMLYGFLLTFGFIMMTPQLFINYKLKSVAHLPWRMLTYKALNTFIDDLFAFVIKMPTLYRLGCFRDDIVFIIYVYQRYKYRVDPKRMNEFGTSGDMFEPKGEAVADSSTAEIKENGEPIAEVSPPKALHAKKNKKSKKTD